MRAYLHRRLIPSPPSATPGFLGRRAPVTLQRRPRLPFASNTSHSQRLSILLQASSLWTLAASAVLVCGGLALQGIHVKHQESKHPSIHHDPDSDRSGQSRLVATLEMAISSKSTGHVGNLTKEEEAKLREFWAVVLKVFGASQDKVTPQTDEMTTQRNCSPTDNTPTLGRKEKKRTSFFWKTGGSAVNGDEPSGITDAIPGISDGSVRTLDMDDKYSQPKEFQDVFACQSPVDLRTAFWEVVKHDHPDALMLRFLRARKWDIDKALIMILSALRWRTQKMRVDDDVMKRGEGGALEDSKSADPNVRRDGEGFLNQLRIGESFIHGLDKEGRPICLVRVRLHRTGLNSETSMERYTVFVIETARLLLQPPVDTAAIIFDMTDFSLANMDYAPVKFMIKCFEANYPESLGVVLIHKAPWIFSGIWNVIKGWLDPVVAAKIHFTRTLEDLEEFVPRTRILKELGGDDDFVYRYVEPDLDENIKQRDTVKRDALMAVRWRHIEEFQDATLTWIYAASLSDDECTLAKRRREQLASQLRDSYWQVDPYVRARSFYDRIGVLQSQGKIEPYTQAIHPTADPKQIGQAPKRAAITNDDNDVD